MADPLRDGDPQRIGTYSLLARLGGGGMGQVFLGTSRGGHRVAVKVVRPELADDARFRRRFATEVAAARKVGGFYTAPVVDADPDGDPPWLATAYIPGPSLDAAVASPARSSRAGRETSRSPRAATRSRYAPGHRAARSSTLRPSRTPYSR